jgi:hypothetical protein
MCLIILSHKDKDGKLYEKLLRCVRIRNCALESEEVAASKYVW